MKVKNHILFEDTNECIHDICEMVDREIRVDYSVKPPVMRIDDLAINVGDCIGIMEDGSVFVEETPHPIEQARKE